MTNLATLENAMATLLVDYQPREAAHLKLYLDLIHLEEYYIQHVRVLACDFGLTSPLRSLSKVSKIYSTAVAPRT
jgi:hypothetical protein